MTADHCLSNEQYPLTVKTDYYQLQFSTTGKLVSFLNAGGEEQINADDPGKAFYLLLNMQTEIPLCELVWQEGNILKCSCANGTQSVFFKVTPRDRYCHFELVKLIGIPSTSVLTLHFGLNTIGNLKAFDTDYMTFVVGKDGPENDDIEHAHHNCLVTRVVSDNNLQVQFEFIWNRHPDNPLGGFALYVPGSDDEEDDIVLEIWANEGLPHPKVDEPWTHERAKQWVADWQEIFAERNLLMLEGASLEELYEGAEFAKRSGCNEIYLFTNSWRHGFMTHNEYNWEIRRDIWPNGESDMRAYSDYLWENGIRLTIHYVSGGLGAEDPMYVVKPDDRLASYGEFELVDGVGESDTTIRVRPLNGLELPYLVDDSNAYPRLPGMYRRMFNFHSLRIGNEIIQVGEFLDTDTDTWTLANCVRSTNTVVASHTTDEPVKGLITAYGRMKLPENDSTLLEEVAKGYAGLLNRCRIWHAEYDGAEIHNYTGNWAFQKFTSLVYQNVDHPITSHDSGAVNPKCHIEHRLNSTRKLMEGHCSYTHGSYSVPFALDSNSRPAVNKLDTHYTLSQGYKGGALGIAKPEPMFGVRPKDLKAHGQIDDLVDILCNWREVAANLTDEQRKVVESSFQYLPDRYERSKHLASKNVFVARKEGEKLSLVPTSVMTREVGDPLWIHGQEHGAIPPLQYVKLDAPGREPRSRRERATCSPVAPQLRPTHVAEHSDSELTLKNPNAEQTPKFVIRLAQNYDYDMETKSVFTFEEIAGKAEELEHLFEAGNAADGAAERLSIDCNMLLDPKLDEFSGQSLTSVEVSDDGYVFAAENPVDTDFYEAYKLPTFNCRANMANHRGIGLTIEGDGSGAIFAIQIAGRDYVVPIDFTGEKYVEILNGEVAWHEERWGWRMGAKHTRYSMVTWFRTGFCHIPASTSCRVEVKKIKLLKEISVPLKELTISSSTGTLTVCGDIATGDYIEYDDGDTALISDANFNPKQTVQVENSSFTAKPGYDTYQFSADQQAWIEVQLFTQGDEMVVKAGGRRLAAQAVHAL